MKKINDEYICPVFKCRVLPGDTVSVVETCNRWYNRYAEFVDYDKSTNTVWVRIGMNGRKTTAFDVTKYEITHAGENFVH